MDKSLALEKLRKSFPTYSKTVLNIITKAGRMNPFELNSSQLKLHKAIVRQKKETGRVRTLVLKARQMGISTYVEGRFFWLTTKTPYCSAFVLSHLQESTSAIFRMVTNFYENVPDPIFAPDLEMKTLTSMRFKDLGSQYRVGTAKTGATGRSQTNQLVHGSEVAYYPDPEQVVAGLLQTVAPMGTEAILESTANGVGGWFHDRCMECLDGKKEWQLVFNPWFEMEEYALRPEKGMVLTPEEQELSRIYSLTHEQIAFRRSKVLELGSEELFRQEYPSTPREAFLTSGRSVISQMYLDALEKECLEAVMLADVGPSGVVQSPYGMLTIWETPKKDKQYCIGADVAEGLEHGDYSCAQVLDHTGKQVACYHGHIDPYDFGDILNQLGRYYQKAYMLVERNNHGLTTIRRLQDLGYPMLYVEQQLDYAYGDKITKKAGWLTTQKTKPLIIDSLARSVITGESGIVDRELIKELRTYVVDERGRTNAQTGCYDDRVMAYAIARYGTTCMPKRIGRPVYVRSYNPVDATVGY